MRNAILNFNKQFEFEPKIENFENLVRKDFFIVAGMGGSHLAADILRSLNRDVSLMVHSDYDLSSFSKTILENCTVIASSYSGNTEETISILENAIERNIPVAAVFTGGKIEEMANEHSIPYVKMPDTGIQPRSALGFNIMSLMKIVGEETLLAESHNLSVKLVPSGFESDGRNLAEKLRNKVPVIYSSSKNQAVSYNWKIKFNETGKIPAFYNVFPELNHNEMTGFDVKENSKKLSEIFHFVFLKDEEDHPKILKRMEITEKLYADRGLAATALDFKGDSRMERIFSSLILADWASYYTANIYGLEAEQVPIVEELKKLIKD